MDEQERLRKLRQLRRELSAGSDGSIWVALCSRFGVTDKALAALDLAYELGYEDGESSAQADAAALEDL